MRGSLQPRVLRLRDRSVATLPAKGVPSTVRVAAPEELPPRSTDPTSQVTEVAVHDQLRSRVGLAAWPFRDGRFSALNIVVH